MTMGLNFNRSSYRHIIRAQELCEQGGGLGSSPVPLAPLVSVLATPRGPFGTHFGQNIKVRLLDLQTGSFGKWSCTN